jgi:hypothetical protein
MVLFSPMYQLLINFVAALVAFELLHVHTGSRCSHIIFFRDASFMFTFDVRLPRLVWIPKLTSLEFFTWHYIGFYMFQKNFLTRKIKPFFFTCVIL